jgi:hypothetical protein
MSASWDTIFHTTHAPTETNDAALMSAKGSDDMCTKGWRVLQVPAQADRTEVGRDSPRIPC